MLDREFAPGVPIAVGSSSVCVVSLEAVMLRKLKTVVVAALVVLAGAQAASAAPLIRIGTFALDGGLFDEGYLTITNETDGDFAAFFGESATFEGMTLTFGANQESLSDLGANPLGVQFVEPTYNGLTAVLSFALRGTSGPNRLYAGAVTFNNVIVYDNCPDGDQCGTASIFYEPTPDEIPVPEPTALLLLTGGLGTIAARRVRRRA